MMSESATPADAIAAAEKLESGNKPIANPTDEKRVLVLCASGATSSMLAKAITKGPKNVRPGSIDCHGLWTT